MAVYLIIDTQRIKDPERYRQYGSRAADIIRAHGGTYLAATGNITPISPDWQPERMVLIRFDNQEQMDACFASQAYQDIVGLRLASVEGRAVLIDDTVSHG